MTRVTSYVAGWPLSGADKARIRRLVQLAHQHGAFPRYAIRPDQRTTTLTVEWEENPEHVGRTLRRMLCCGKIPRKQPSPTMPDARPTAA